MKLTYDESHSECLFKQYTDDARVHPQPMTRLSANRALANGWPLDKIKHIHIAVSPLTDTPEEQR